MDNSIREAALGMAGIRAYFYELTGHTPHRTTVFRWIYDGKLTARKIGGRIYAYPSDIRAMLERQTCLIRAEADCEFPPSATNPETGIQYGDIE